MLIFYYIIINDTRRLN